MHERTKDFFENKIGAPTKDFFENKIGAPTKDFFENKLPEHTKDFFENKIGAPIKESFENLGHKRPVNWRYISSPQRMNNDSVADVATETVDMENHDGGNTVGEMFV
ncbi:rhoptry associated protein 1, putative [Babesia ovis]|uniref:Rhoptry associated protein 1, putative n=1 Tax=Babesia ovis TaxID=5869 RepID=A0A9W5TAA6_BABOV|nr:rhoptry associated protein 1, putative [Babesia ovis]